MRRQRWLIALGLVVLCIIAYAAIVGPWQRHWGATPAEVTQTLPGDGLVTSPDEVTTRAITIHAQPEHVWPWLAQMVRRQLLGIRARAERLTRHP
jgi:hypothetical protein